MKRYPPIAQIPWLVNFFFPPYCAQPGPPGQHPILAPFSGQRGQVGAAYDLATVIPMNNLAPNKYNFDIGSSFPDSIVSGASLGPINLEVAVKKDKRGKLLWIFLFMLLLLGMEGCSENGPAQKSAAVKVGALFPMSGDLADKGADSANGVRLAVDDVNAAGGILALGGAKLELILGDTQGRPEIGAEEAERLIRGEGVAALIGTYQSSVTKPATQVAERLETPFLVSISIADVITERGFQYTFRIQPQARFYARDQVLFLKDMERLVGYSVQRVALLHENTDFGTSAALSQKTALREHGLEMVSEVSYQAEGVKDLSAEVGQTLAARPDAILAVTYLKDCVLIRQAMARQGSRVPLLDTAGGAVSPEYISMLGPLAEDTLTVAEFSKFTAGGRELNGRFRARFGVDITGDSAHAYQAVLVLKDALERAGSANREKLRAALAVTDLRRGPQMVLPAERLRFDAQGQNQFAKLFVAQIIAGELVPVWPDQYSAAKINIRR